MFLIKNDDYLSYITVFVRTNETTRNQNHLQKAIYSEQMNKYVTDIVFDLKY